MLSKETVSKIYVALSDVENDCNKQPQKTMSATIKGHVAKFRLTLKKLGYSEKTTTAPAQVPFQDTTPPEQTRSLKGKEVEEGVIHQEEVMNKEAKKPRRRKPKTKE
jgi:hypothetical protein